MSDTPSGESGELQKELRYYADLLHVHDQMKTFGSVRDSVSSGSPRDMSRYSGVSGYSGYSDQSGYFVMELDPDLRTVQIRGYRQDEIGRASSDVALTERSNPNTVLVAAADLVKLKEAYPNWVFDTSNFLGVLEYTINPQVYL